MIDIKNLRDDINAVSKSLQRRGYNLDIEKFYPLGLITEINIISGSI